MLKQFVKYTVAFCISLLVAWTIGFWTIASGHYIQHTWIAWGKGILNALLATGVFILFLFPLYYLFYRWKKLLFIIHLLFSLLLLLEILSLFYYSVSIAPIDSSLFLFSSSQAALVMKSYFIFQWYYLLIPVPILLYSILIRRVTIRREKFIFTSLIILSIPVLFGFQFKIGTGSYSDLATNKTLYFVRSFFKNETPPSLTKEDIYYYQTVTNPDLHNLNYPLYRPTYKANPLGPFFNLKTQPPNIVVIIVESLSSSFSGPRADEISYTPFLDSLAQHSLYFDNSLATAQRSFAALPSTLGSLPQGKLGFTHSNGSYPDNMTLPKWLFKNGYSGSFHYGGYARFDHMDLFLHNQGFRHIYSRKEYNYAGTGLRTSIDSIPFGIPDKELFKQSMVHMDKRSDSSSNLDVYFTLSMHYPFMTPDAKKYYVEVAAIIKKAIVSKEIKAKHRKYIKELSSFLYTDDALHYFFNAQEKTKAYQNTIYIIMGDHMMGDIPQNNTMEEYRSVLMIYSPLLKRHKVIRGVNSQLDISPSLYQLLHHRYHYPALDSVSWLGQPFDTSSTFQCNRDVLFMLNNKHVKDILHRNYFYSRGQLYTVGNRLKIKPLNNDKVRDSMQKLLTVSKKIHASVVSNDRLIPPSSPSEMIGDSSKNLIITDQTEFASIWHTTLHKTYTSLSFDMDAKFIDGWGNTPKKERPILIYNVKRGDSSLLWNRVDINYDILSTAKKEKFHFSIQNNLNLTLQKGDKVLVYFWNKALKKSKNFTIQIQPIIIKAR